jgi:hypothetical protein
VGGAGGEGEVTSTATYDARRQLVVAAQSILRGELSVIEGARTIDGHVASAGMDAFDEDCMPFRLVVCETERFPTGSVRQLWDPGALAKLQPEFDEAEKWARETALPHCQRLIDRFDSAAVRREIGQVARAMLDGEVSFIAGAHRVAFLQAYAELSEFDADLTEFTRIHSTHASLPPTDGREHWPPEKLLQRYPEIPRAEAEARQGLASDCQKLVDRFL